MTQNLTETDIETAFFNAENKLLNEDNLWIRESALLERAYMIGVLNALEALGETSHINGRFIMALSRTLSQREKDRVIQSDT